MPRFIEGDERSQSVLFPERLDDWVTEDNPVRVIDVFVNELDLGVLGFERALPAATGRPGYDPATLLKIYVYGYLNRIQSSRRLEREAQRNVELIWLTGRLMPDFKTIADFRRDNGLAIRKVCARFVMLCRKMNLFTEAVVAIDGSKFKAVNTRDKNFTRHKIKVRMEHLEQAVGQYLNELDRADREPASVLGSRVSHLQDKIEAVKAEMRKIGEIEKHLEKSPDQQVSLTDPDARSMNSAGKGTGIVGYNVQRSRVPRPIRIDDLAPALRTGERVHNSGLLCHLVLHRRSVCLVVVDHGHRFAVGRHHYPNDVGHLALAAVRFLDCVVRDPLQRNPGLARVIGRQVLLAVELRVVALPVPSHLETVGRHLVLDGRGRVGELRHLVDLPRTGNRM